MGNSEISKFLILNGADTSIRNFQGKTPAQLKSKSNETSVENNLLARRQERASPVPDLLLDTNFFIAPKPPVSSPT